MHAPPRTGLNLLARAAATEDRQQDARSAPAGFWAMLPPRGHRGVGVCLAAAARAGRWKHLRLLLD